MIVRFKNKNLEALWYDGKSSKIDKRLHGAILEILDYIDAVEGAESFGRFRGFHPLKGNRKGTYAVSVTGNLRITFRFEQGDATDLDLEDYH